MSVVVDGVLGSPRLARHTWRCTCISVVPEATHEASRGSETETRELLGGTEDNSNSPLRGIDLPPRQINDFLQKGNRKN